MKKSINLSIKKSIIVITAAVLCTACNSGQNSSTGSAGDTSSNANATVVESGQSAQHNKVKSTKSSAAPSFGAQDLVFSNDVRLGAGYDIYQNLPRPAGTGNVDYMNQLLDTNGDLAYTAEGQMYKAWASTDGSYSEGARASKQAGSLAIGGGYGGYSASMKMAMEQSSTRFNQNFEQAYNFGVKVASDIHFPISPTATNAQVSLDSTKNAILNANPIIREAIEQIDSASTVEERARLVAEFYGNHGQYFVSSVTQGYLGSEAVTMTQNESSGTDANGMSFEGSFSSPFAGGSASYSQANSSAFKNADWSHTLTVSMAPNNPGLYSLMSSVNNEFQMQMNNIGYSFTISQMTSYGSQSVLNSGAQEPQLPKFDFKVSEQDKQAVQANTAAKKEVASTVGALEEITQAIYSTLQSGGNVTGLVTSLNSLLTTEYQSKGKYDPQLHSDYYTASQKQTIYSAYVVKQQLSSNPSIGYDALIAAVNSDYYVSKYGKVNSVNKQVADNNKKVKDEAGNSVFSNWLQNVKYKSDCANCTSYENWLASRSVGQIDNYMIEWEALQNNLSQGSQQLAKIEKKMVLKSSSTNKALFKSAVGTDPSRDNTAPVVLDFSLMPWSSIFPELITDRVNDYSTLMVYTTLQAIDDYLNDYNYYKLTLKYAPASDQANDPYLGDMTTYNNTLQGAVNSLTTSVFSSNKSINFNGVSYQLDDKNSVGAFTEAVKTYIANTPIRKSDWYKAVLPYKEKGLINPNGNLIMLTDAVTSTSGFKPEMSMALIDKKHVGEMGDQVGGIMTLPYYKNDHRSLAKQFVDKSAASADTALHTVVSMLPVIYKQKYSGKYDVSAIFYNQTKVRPYGGTSYSSFYGGQLYGLTSSTSAYYHDILTNIPVYDPAKTQVGYPMKTEYWNDFCSTFGGKQPDAYSGFAWYAVNDDGGEYVNAVPCMRSTLSGLNIGRQSMVIFPINSSLVHQISEVSNGAKPVFADFYQDNSSNLAAIKYAMGM